MSNFQSWLCAAVAAIAFVGSSEAFSEEDYGNWNNDGCGNDIQEDVCCNNQWNFDFGGEAFLDYEFFRSVPEGDHEGNLGAVIGANLGMPLPFSFCDCWGVQLGASFGVYDWAGRGPGLLVGSSNPGATQKETFVTLGIYRKSPWSDDFNYGFAYDWQFNKHAGLYGLNPNLSQFRFQFAYEMPCDELGLWGTVHTHSTTKSIAGFAVKFRAVNQINFFWRHDFGCCARTNFWVGVPYGKSLRVSGHRPGQYTLGANFKVPLVDCWAVEGRALYMGARRQSGGLGANNYAANVCLGLTYAFGNGRGDGCDLQPYLPMGNNSNFIVDASSNNFIVDPRPLPPS